MVSRDSLLANNANRKKKSSSPRYPFAQNTATNCDKKTLSKERKSEASNSLSETSLETANSKISFLEEKLANNLLQQKDVLNIQNSYDVKLKAIEGKNRVLENELLETKNQKTDNSEIARLKKKISKLEETITDLKINKSSKDYTSLYANEIKVREAIQKEKTIQKSEWPVIPRSVFRITYSINEKYLGQSIHGLLEKGYINSRPAKTTTNKVSTSYSIAKEEEK